MTRAERIRTMLDDAFSPREILVSDESAKHAGHAGADSGGESHYDVRIVSDRFHGVSRVERQRRIYAALDGEFREGLHALSVKALTPAEAGSASST